MTTTTSTAGTLFWACDSCRLPVHGRGGHVCLRDGEWCIYHSHGGCDPDPGNLGHWFPITRATTAMDLLGQTAFLLRKGLLAGTTWSDFLYRILGDNNWEGRP